MGNEQDIGFQPFGDQLQRFQPGIAAGFNALILLLVHADPQLHVGLLQAEGEAALFDLGLEVQGLSASSV